MSDARPSLVNLGDDQLADELRALSAWLDTVPPTTIGGLDPAARIRLRLEASGQRPPRRSGGRFRWAFPRTVRPVRRAFALALVAVIVVAAIAAAIGFGLPGIQFVAGPTASIAPSGPTGPSSSAPSSTSATPTPTSTVAGPLGSRLGLGMPIDVATASDAVDFTVIRPPVALGAAEAAWLLDQRLSLVWRSGPGLPAAREPGIGLILTEFRGSVDPGYFQKIIGPNTTVVPVTIDGAPGYWIGGDPHEIVFVDPSGLPVFDSRRIVGDTLLWARGDMTYRLESGLGRAEAIALAESLR